MSHGSGLLKPETSERNTACNLTCEGSNKRFKTRRNNPGPDRNPSAQINITSQYRLLYPDREVADHAGWQHLSGNPYIPLMIYALGQLQSRYFVTQVPSVALACLRGMP